MLNICFKGIANYRYQKQQLTTLCLNASAIPMKSTQIKFESLYSVETIDGPTDENIVRMRGNCGLIKNITATRNGSHKHEAE